MVVRRRRTNAPLAARKSHETTGVALIEKRGWLCHQQKRMWPVSFPQAYFTRLRPERDSIGQRAREGKGGRRRTRVSRKNNPHVHVSCRTAFPAVSDILHLYGLPPDQHTTTRSDYYKKHKAHRTATTPLSGFVFYFNKKNVYFRPAKTGVVLTAPYVRKGNNMEFIGAHLIWSIIAGAKSVAWTVAPGIACVVPGREVWLARRGLNCNDCRFFFCPSNALYGELHDD